MKKFILLLGMIFVVTVGSSQVGLEIDRYTPPKPDIFVFEVDVYTKFPMTLVNENNDTLHVISTWELQLLNHLLDVNSDYKRKVIELETTIAENNLILKKNGLLTGTIDRATKSNELLVRNNERVIDDAWDIHTQTLKLTKQTTQSVSNIEDYFTKVTDSKIKKLRILSTVLGGVGGYLIGNEIGSPIAGTLVGAGGTFILTYVF